MLAHNLLDISMEYVFLYLFTSKFEFKPIFLGINSILSHYYLGVELILRRFSLLDVCASKILSNKAHKPRPTRLTLHHRLF